MSRRSSSTGAGACLPGQRRRWGVLAVAWLVCGTVGAVALSGCGDEAGDEQQRGPADVGPGDGGEPLDLAPDGGPGTDLSPADQGPPADLGDPADLEPPDGGTPDGGDGGPPPDPALAELLALGKLRLAEARAHDALRVFEQALALRPESPEARYGAALAGAIDSVELSSMMLSLTGQVDGLAISRDEYIAAELHRLLLALRAGFVLALERAEAVDPEALDFEVEAAWVYFGLRPALVLRGVFDGGDVHLTRAVLALLTSLLDVLCAQDVRTDLLTVVEGFRGGGPSTFDFATIGGLLGQLLRAEPGALFALHPEDGPAMFAAGRTHLATIGRELEAAVGWMLAAGDVDPRPQVSRLEPAPRGGWLITVRNGVTPPPPDADPTLEPGPPEERELATSVTQVTLDAFTHASRAIDTPGDLVLFRQEVVPILAVLAHTMLQVGMLSSLTDSLPFPLASLDREAVELLLGNFLPLPAALDLGTFFAQPSGLRPFFPVVTADEPARFLAEWECPAELDGNGYPPVAKGLLCSTGASLTDAGHFGGTPWEIAADGLSARLPYLAWDDPTFHGLLRVDLSDQGVAGWEEPGWRAPDLYALDAMIAGNLGNLIALVGGLLE